MGNACDDSNELTTSMKWIEDIKAMAAAFKDWARLLAVLGCVVAGLLVVIAIELLVICFKI